MKYLKIYLAGKMTGLTFEEMNSWREILKSRLLLAADNCDYKLCVINPVDYYNFEEVKHQSEREVKEYDLRHVITSNIVIVNVDGLGSSDGTKIEIHDASYHNRIPVIALDEKNLYKEIHPWIQDEITRVERSTDDVVDYIKDFYMV